MSAGRLDLSVYNGRRCVVTGHTGFKGTWLSLWLQRLGAEVHGYALNPVTTPNLFDLTDLKELLEDYRADIREASTVKDYLLRTSPEVVFHLAAQPLVRRSYSEPRQTFDTNVNGTLNVLDAIRQCPSVRALVVVTSDKCYQNLERVHPYRETDRLGGHDPYSASKAAVEIVCAAYRDSFFTPAGVGLATARAGNVIGGGDWAEDRIVPDAIRALAKGHSVPVRNPYATRPWQHVLEPLFGYLALGAQLLKSAGDPTRLERHAGPWNFGPPTESCLPVRALVEAFLAAYGSGEWNDLSSDQADAPHEARLLALDWSKAYHGLGWRPRWSFDETVRRTCAWYQKLAEGYHARALCIHEIAAYTEMV